MVLEKYYYIWIVSDVVNLEMLIEVVGFFWFVCLILHFKKGSY